MSHVESRCCYFQGSKGLPVTCNVEVRLLRALCEDSAPSGMHGISVRTCRQAFPRRAPLWLACGLRDDAAASLALAGLATQTAWRAGREHCCLARFRLYAVLCAVQLVMFSAGPMILDGLPRAACSLPRRPSCEASTCGPESSALLAFVDPSRLDLEPQNLLRLWDEVQTLRTCAFGLAQQILFLTWHVCASENLEGHLLWELGCLS
ncbi:hypothetical protein AK812_SmicGene27179 [Symbiodinium microadriaticum]|uniref:Uncharacterized protein n=1 Tax=Symbiodinium microadriaticum TaxID=2951 RepID=A0A1Q9D7K7_SYMMI|nr:hypothetical protein AK812_SmicGene27179 [Symbiodinium microadriaticum]